MHDIEDEVEGYACEARADGRCVQAEVEHVPVGGPGGRGQAHDKEEDESHRGDEANG